MAKVQLIRTGPIPFPDSAETRETGTDGGFVFESVPDGEYALGTGGVQSGAADRFGRLMRGGLDLRAGHPIESIELKLARPGSIAGNIVGTHDEPVAYAGVFVRDESGEVLHGWSPCSSDETGAFSYAGIAPGRYTVSARDATLAAPDGPVIEVREGEVTRSDIQLRRATVLNLGFEDASGEPINGIYRIRDERGRDVADLHGTASAMAYGTWNPLASRQRRGPLPPGKYTVRADTAGGLTASAEVTLLGEFEKELVLRIPAK
jgi:hypothetical protein